MKIKNEKIFLYIDTSIFIHFHFDFYHPVFQQIKTGIDNGNIVVLWNSILEGEFRKHCLEDLDKGLSNLRKAGSIGTLKNAQVKNILKLEPNLAMEDVLKKFKQDFKVKDIDSNIDWRIIFNKYFQLQPPFSKEKQKEFPDAFVAEMLEPYKFERLHIVASDNDFTIWGTKNKVKTFQSLPDFTDHYIKEVKEYQALVKAVKKLLPTKLNEIQSSFNETLLDIDNYHLDSDASEIDSVELKALKAPDVSIMKVDLKSRTLSLTLDFDGQVNLEISSSKTMIDPIDKDLMNFGYSHNNGTLDFYLFNEVEITLSPSLKSITNIEISEPNFYTETFEIPPDWESPWGDDHPDYDDPLGNR